MTSSARIVSYSELGPERLAFGTRWRSEQRRPSNFSGNDPTGGDRPSRPDGSPRRGDCIRTAHGPAAARVAVQMARMAGLYQYQFIRLQAVIQVGISLPRERIPVLLPEVVNRVDSSQGRRATLPEEMPESNFRLRCSRRWLQNKFLFVV